MQALSGASIVVPYMIIDDEIFNNYITKLIKVSLEELANTRYYYSIINNRSISDFIYSNNAGTPHFRFLKEVLLNQELAKCPKCGHYNDNIECPIVVCGYCNTEFIIHSDSSEDVCNDCIAYKTKHCDKKPII